jgi:segregation and condensation protein B
MQTKKTTLIKNIEAVLFWKGDPLTVAELAKMLHASVEEIREGIDALRSSRAESGIVVISHNDTYTLGSSSDVGALIESIRKEELQRDLGKAGLETLATIIYKHPIKRSEIDFIRGVNSSFILRNLLIRGLIDKVSMPHDTRSTYYTPSMEMLSHLGITSIQELSNYNQVTEELARFKKDYSEEHKSEEHKSESSIVDNSGINTDTSDNQASELAIDSASAHNANDFDTEVPIEIEREVDQYMSASEQYAEDTSNDVDIKNIYSAAQASEDVVDQEQGPEQVNLG